MAVDKQTLTNHHNQENDIVEETSSSSSSSPHQEECPLCLEDLDFDDRSFFPCTCGYQICRFCWHKILSETDSLLGEQGKKGSCPACRKPYSEDPANFKPLSCEELKAHTLTLKKQKKQQKASTKKQNTSIQIDKSKLQDLRVVQKNLVFVVGITPKIADPELLKKNEYFGRFGKIRKIVVNHQIQQNGSGGGSVTYGAYVTFVRSTSALKAIQSVNNVAFDGKTIKASLGTTKYCSHFMRGQACPKQDCMYLHGLGDPLASFTKEDMQQGKHQDYERKLLMEFCKEEEIARALVSSNVVEESPPPSPVLQQNKVCALDGRRPLQNHTEEEGFESLLQPPSLQQDPFPLHRHVDPPQQEETHQPPPQEELDLDFDPFYETQKAFESIIQQEMLVNSRQQNNPPPGFVNHQRMNDFDDPAIIFSSTNTNGATTSPPLHMCNGGEGGGGNFDGFLMRNSDYYPNQYNNDLLYYFQNQSFKSDFQQQNFQQSSSSVLQKLFSPPPPPQQCNSSLQRSTQSVDVGRELHCNSLQRSTRELQHCTSLQRSTQSVDVGRELQQPPPGFNGF